MQLTVATWNVYLGADLALLFGATSPADLAARIEVVRGQLTRTSFDERAAALVRVLVRERVDVAGLQEVSRWALADGPTERILEDFLPALLEQARRAGFAYDVHAVAPSFSGGLPVDGAWMSVAGANVLLVRRDGPVRVTAERVGRFAATVEVPTGMPGVTFPVVRGWGWVDVEVAGRPARIVNTHTEAYDAVVRDAQRDELVALVDEVAGPVVVLGDLNADPGALVVPPRFVDAAAHTGGDAVGPTCGRSADLADPSAPLRERIDYVLVRGAQVRACRRAGHRAQDRTDGGLWPSDHAAVVANIEL